MLPPDPYLTQLQAQGLLPPTRAAAIAAAEQARPFSLHYELRAFLYLGITLLAGGLGVLVYQNLDSIGHRVIIGTIALLMAACFAYAARHRAPFTWGEAPKTSVGADYLLILSCLLFVILEGYLQYQYQLFGTQYGLATALPALVFIPIAYRFDHRGVLAMGLSALAAWVGLNATPLQVLENNFDDPGIRAAALGLGLALSVVGLWSERAGRKAHFAFTYLLLGCNLALIALLVTMVKTGRADDELLLSFGAAGLTLGLCAGLFWYARRTHSYWFLVLSAGYGYFAMCWTVVLLLSELPDELTGAAVYLFFPLSLGLMIYFFVNIRKLMDGPAPAPAAPDAPAVPAPTSTPQ